MAITFVTGNKNKLLEVQAIVGDRLTNQDVDLIEIQGSYSEIIEHKAKSAAEQVNGPVMVEDTGLEFAAWGELPGPYVKWFLKSIGPEGLVKMLDGFDNKASAVTHVGFCAGPGQPVEIFVGRTTGRIVGPRGPQTFGWDCTFEPDGYDKTYAELDKPTKNSISQRGKAMAKFKEFLDANSY